ncbi:MAG: GntR family transcriptional regulator [Thalassobaculales bacterium]
MRLEPIRPLTAAPSLAEQAHGAIMDAIAEGRLSPGARVTQTALAAMLGVSRAPIQQVLPLLRRQGLLVEAAARGPGGPGLMVAPLDPRQMRQIYEIRAALDGMAAGLAARRARPADIAEGEALLAEGRRAEAAGDLARLIAADGAFHRLIYRAAGNPLFAETAAQHWQHIRRVMGAVLRSPAGLGPVWDEHAAILAAIADGDAAAAEARARGHAEAASRRLAGDHPAINDLSGSTP